MKLKNYLLRNVFRAPEGEGTPGGEPAAPTAETPPSYAEFDLDFDPVPQGREEEKPVEENGGEPAPASTAGEPVVKEEPVKATPEPAPTPTPEPAPAGKDPKDLLLEHLQKEVQRLTGAQEQPKAKEPVSTDPDEDFLKAYDNIPISDGILGALASDDPEERRQVLRGLLSGVLKRAARDARTFVREQVEGLRTQVPKLATSTIETQTEAQRIGADFFGTYSQYNHPGLQPAVGQAMQEVAAQMTAAGTFAGYNPAFKEAVGKRLYALTGIPDTAPAPTSAPASAPAPKSQPFVSGGGGGRAPAPSTNEFSDVLGEF